MSRISKNVLTIQNLRAGIVGKEILRGINLTVRPGTVTAIMGPNGSGKSTLANVLLGHPGFEVTAGRVLFSGKNILRLKTHERARLGLFLAFQYPVEIPGVNMREALWVSYSSLTGKRADKKVFERRLKKALISLSLSDKFLERSLNEGFSGGEKKKAEILQLIVLSPAISILDEVDSGLDIDSLRLIAQAIRQSVSRHHGVLVITHYQRLLNYLKPDTVHIMVEGRIAASGGFELVKKLEKQGYGWVSNYSSSDPAFGGGVEKEGSRQTRTIQ